MNIYVYAMPPIDFWQGWTKVNQITFSNEDDQFDRAEFDLLWDNARAMAYDVGWEGDIRGDEHYVSGLPYPDGGAPCYMIAWKQENNGTTFIASPYRLAHLEADPYVKSVGGEV